MILDTASEIKQFCADTIVFCGATLVALSLIMPFYAHAEEEALQIHPTTVEQMTEMVAEGDTRSAIRAATALGKARVSKQPAVDALKEMLSHPDTTAQCAALYALGRSGRPEVASAIVPLLSASVPEVRIAACRALAKTGTAEHTGSLPLRDENLSVQMAAVSASVELDGSNAASPLIKLFRETTSPAVQVSILEALQSMPPEPDVPSVAEAALTMDDVQVQAQGMKLLASLPPEELRSLRQKLEKGLEHHVASVRRNAVAAYAKALSEKDADFTKVIDRIDDADATVRVAVTAALGEHCSVWTEIIRLEQLFSDPVREVRRSASKALVTAAKRQNGWRDDLEKTALQATQSSESRVRREGLWILGQIESQAAFPHVLRIARDPSTEAERREARLVAWLIGRTRYEDGGKLLIKLFTHEDRFLRVHAAKGLGVLRVADAVPLISDTLKKTKVVDGIAFFDYVGPERHYALWALGKIATPQALETLGELSVMTRPAEGNKNLRLICNMLVENNYTTAADAIVSHCRQSSDPVAGTRKQILAKAVHKLTGEEKVAIPETPVKYQEFFLHRLSE